MLALALPGRGVFSEHWGHDMKTLLFLALPTLAIAACGSDSPAPDAAVTVALDVARPEGPPTLATDVDPARLVADIAPVVADFIRQSEPAMLAPLGFTSADADAMQLGRPYGVFMVHKGPWLAFSGSWSVPVLVGGVHRSIVDVKREGDKYVFVGIGGADFAPTLAAREQLPAVSAALDRGRAGLLRAVGAGGASWLAYELAATDPTQPPDIRVQSLGWYLSAIPGIDGSVPPPESTLAELDKTLPPE
jgi:hypothetical protein